jgi:PDGLE domain
MTSETKRHGIGRWWWVGGLALAALVVVLLSPLASSDPDGLERVAIDQGFANRAENPPFTILADYLFPGLDPTVATIVAGLIGVLVVFGVVIVVGRLLASRRRGRDQ